MALFCCWMICRPREETQKLTNFLHKRHWGCQYLFCCRWRCCVLTVCLRHHDEQNHGGRTCTADRARAKATLVALATAVAMDWELAADMPCPAQQTFGS